MVFLSDSPVYFLSLGSFSNASFFYGKDRILNFQKNKNLAGLFSCLLCCPFDLFLPFPSPFLFPGHPFAFKPLFSCRCSIHFRFPCNFLPGCFLNGTNDVDNILFISLSTSTANSSCIYFGSIENLGRAPFA